MFEILRQFLVVHCSENDCADKPDTERCSKSTQCQFVSDQIGGRGFSSLGIDLELLDRKPDVQEVRAHKAQVPKNLMQEALVEEHIGDELVPASCHHMTGSDGHDDQQLDGADLGVCVGQLEDHHRAEHLCPGEQSLMPHLVIEVVIEIIPNCPPGVVMRIHGGQEQDSEPPAQPASDLECGEILDTFIEGDQVDQGDGPHGPGLPGGVEVHVFVDPRPRLVASLEVRVPATVGAVISSDIDTMVRP